MARIVGTSGCTTELLAELGRRGITGLGSFADAARFYASRDAILAEARAREGQTLLSRAMEFSTASLVLRECVDKKVAARRAELLATADQLSSEIAELQAPRERWRLGAIRAWIRRLWLRFRLQALVRDLDDEATRPFKSEAREAQRLLEQSEETVRRAPLSIEAAVAPLEQVKRYLEGDGRAAYFGALGEERVLDFLRALPDEFTIFNNITFVLPRGHNWREHGEWVQRAQVDHVVVGNDCLFLLETKNWSDSTRRVATFSPEHQIKRANHVVYCLARDQFGGWFGHRKLHLRNVVVMVQNLSRRPERFPPPYEHVTSVPAHFLAQFILGNRPHGVGHVTSAEACEWVQWLSRSP